MRWSTQWLLVRYIFLLTVCLFCCSKTNQPCSLFKCLVHICSIGLKDTFKRMTSLNLNLKVNKKVQNVCELIYFHSDGSDLVCVQKFKRIWRTFLYFCDWSSSSFNRFYLGFNYENFIKPENLSSPLLVSNSCCQRWIIPFYQFLPSRSHSIKLWDICK